MSNIEFFVKCNPPKTTAQASSRVFKNKYTGKMFIGKDRRGQSVREELMALLRPYVPERILDGALKITIEFGFPYLKSVRKKDIGKIIPKITKPDGDNSCKLIFDCMTRLGFWKDDALLWDIRFRKFYTDTPGIGIKIEKS